MKAGSMVMDLEGVAPARRAEIARRVELLERYATISHPNADDDESFSRQMGVGVGQFLRLVRIWLDHRRPDLLPGAGKPNTSSARQSKVRARRSPYAPNCATIIIDDVAVDLPVRLEAPRTLPIMHLVMPEAGLLPQAWSLHEKRIDAASAAVLLLSLPPHGRTIEKISLPAHLAVGPLPDALSRAGLTLASRPAAGRIGVEARKAIGTSIGGIPLRTRATYRVDAGDMQRMVPMELDAARELLRQTIEFCGEPDLIVSLPETEAGKRLRADLQAIAECEA